ncbi:MAG TPA: HAD family hydrolase [Sedimenticola thiotaurini]|uniref:HAD family hydrolase n=1 Tax=Sedimenticola thiotaurini TaxID=1543721 RepID=A0A831RI20_9GAMM|nr:HAD family hydrolase [Sedimenticola thiotaurini]
MPTPEPTHRLVLFDLDGTLADTAPDLAYALNQTLLRQGREALPFAAIRPHVSHGGIALIRLGFGIGPEHPEFDTLRQRFLDIYLANLTRETRLFPGMEQVLAWLEQRDIPWGVVTNKPAWLTDPLMRQLGLDRRAAAIVSGDTLERRKPHPDPILYACEAASVAPAQTLYVGDARRDIEAGNRAGTTTLAALFGYIEEQDDPRDWQADGMIEAPREILPWVLQDTATAI